MASFVLQLQGGVVAIEIYRLQTLKYLPSALEKCDDLLAWYRPYCSFLNPLKIAEYLILQDKQPSHSSLQMQWQDFQPQVWLMGYKYSTGDNTHQSDVVDIK